MTESSSWPFRMKDPYSRPFTFQISAATSYTVVSPHLDKIGHVDAKRKARREIHQQGGLRSLGMIRTCKRTNFTVHTLFKRHSRPLRAAIHPHAQSNLSKSCVCGIRDRRDAWPTEHGSRRAAFSLLIYQKSHVVRSVCPDVPVEYLRTLF
jgi:hypothetical protein